MSRPSGQHIPRAEREELRSRLFDWIAATGRTPTEFASEFGFRKGTIQKMARDVDATVSKRLTFPSFVEDGDLLEPIENIVARQRENFVRIHSAKAARKWFPITVHESMPYGILWFGDPHLDNSGCNWPLLESHLEVARKPGVYGANIGDTTDNWPWTGRLARLWAESEVSDKTAKRIAEWFMFGAGVRWMIWLIGNHDEWNGGADFYKRLGATDIPILDWRAQFVLHHPGGVDVRVDAAHGRKGSSIYNPSHSTLRAALFGESADLYVTGHIHTYKLDHFEDADRQHVSWLAQVRGYKTADHHALVNGFPEYQHGASVLSVIDPSTGTVMCFGDPVEGAEYLAYLRSKH